MKKKLLALLLALCMVFTLAACGNSESETPDEPDNQQGGEDDPGGEEPNQGDEEDPANTAVLLMAPGGLGDKGWNDDSWAGMENMRDKYGIGIKAVEATGAADVELFLRELAEQGYGLIFCLDTSIVATLMTITEDYPDTMFVVPAKTNLVANTGNYVGMFYALDEMAFLAGVAAAFVATDGNEIVDYAGQQEGCTIGAIFAQESTGFFRYYCAFEHGAKWYNPDAEILVDYTAGYTDTAYNQTIAENMIANGADVVWTCCGAAGYGGLQACRLNGALGIGVDTNQDDIEPGYVLTSAQRMMYNDIETIVDHWQEGTLEGLNMAFDLKSNSVGITDFATIGEHVTNEENFQKLKDLIEDVKQQIIDGEICPYDTAETVYAGEDLVMFDEWWAENKDTNPNNVHDWNFEDALIYE